MLEQLSVLQLTIAFIVLIIAFSVRGISGFGSGLIAIPLLALMLPISITVPLVAGLDYIASFGHGVKHRGNTQWQSIVLLLPFSIDFQFMGVLAHFDSDSQSPHS